MSGRSQDLRTGFWANPTNLVLLVAGLLLVALGVALPYARPTVAKGFAWQSFLGGLATAVGGAVLSWAASLALSRRAATRDIARMLATVTRSIGQASGQILLSMKRARELDIEIPTALELIHQQTRRIQSDVNEVSLIIGTAYNSANVEETIRDIDVVSGILGSTASPEFTKRLSEVKQKLLQGGQVPSIITDPDVPTAKIFRTVTCPKCGKNIKARIHLRPGDTETSAVCLECYSRIGILLPNLTAELRGSLEVIKDPQILGKSGSRPVTACPRCTKRISAQIERDEAYFAICRDDDTMTVVSREAFQTWRNSAEA